MKRLALSIFLLTTVTWLGGCKHSSVTPAEPTKAEYGVLSAYISRNFRGDAAQNKPYIVIIKQTLHLSEDPRWVSALYKYEPTLKTIHHEVFRALLETNRHPSSFQSSFTLPVPYEIVESSEVSPAHGWQGPSCGFLELSRVGFSGDGTHAAFYSLSRIGFTRDGSHATCRELWESGYLVIMEKGPNSDWKIVKEVQLWVT